jgi:hypothetical protein
LARILELPGDRFRPARAVHRVVAHVDAAGDKRQWLTADAEIASIWTATRF